MKETKANIVLAQEHHIPRAGIPEASATMGKIGWKSAWAAASAACKGKAKGSKKVEPTQGGTAVFVRDFLGLATLDREHKEGRDCEIVPGRLCGAKVGLPGGRSLACYSIYLW